MITFQSKLTKKIYLKKDILSLRFSVPESFFFFAGQYVILHIPQENEKVCRRLYSIASPPEKKGEIELVIEVLKEGIGSEFIDKMEVGKEIKIQGPAGLFTLKGDVGDKYTDEMIFMATGTGIAPIKSMIQSLLYKENFAKKTIWLFWGLKKYEDAYLLEEFSQISNESKLNFHICLSRQEEMEGVEDRFKRFCHKGRIDFVYEKLLPENSRRNFPHYVCGARDVVESLKNYLLEKGVKKEKIHFEKF